MFFMLMLVLISWLNRFNYIYTILLHICNLRTSFMKDYKIISFLKFLQANIANHLKNAYCVFIMYLHLLNNFGYVYKTMQDF